MHRFKSNWLLSFFQSRQKARDACLSLLYKKGKRTLKDRPLFGSYEPAQLVLFELCTDISGKFEKIELLINGHQLCFMIVAWLFFILILLLNSYRVKTVCQQIWEMEVDWNVEMDTWYPKLCAIDTRLFFLNALSGLKKTILSIMIK
jgi:hypothetical protein